MPEHEQNETALHLKLANKALKLEIQALKTKPPNTLTFKISNFDPSTSTYGPPFFTSPGGYKMCLGITSKYGYMGVYLHLVQGENDDTLPWPFRPAKIEITLLNQEENKGHESSTIEYSPKKDSGSNRRVTDGERSLFGYGTGKFTPLASLKEPYLMKGILYFRVTILNVPEPKHWLVCN